MKACGIDLGTTNSCVHVVTKDGPKLIKDGQGNATIPSVVYQSRDGKRTVGLAARNRMGELPGPVATIKRKMGSNETVLLGNEQQTPVEVSAIILRYLKKMAESAEGEEVDRAVITVPAYFAHIQRQHTDDAARAAGFKEVTTLLEPVAAALAYSLESAQEKLRVFVYDLGGGTFDATVLEKDMEGGLSVLSFGGDPYLGGDNLDARVVKLLLEKLTAKKYVLNLNLDDPEDYSRYQRLKFFAENAKIGLTNAESVSLVHQGLFTDQTGELLDLDLTITREELEACTIDLVQRSIKESLDTLAKKQIDPTSIDEIIMVGGMSRMPLARRLLSEALRRGPKLVDPDLIVSRGAAIKAAHLYPDRFSGKGGLTVDLRYDRRTDKRNTRITGVLNQTMEQGTAYLLGKRDERSADLAGKDRFAFESVALEAGNENAFAVSIEDAEGAALFGEDIQIVQDDNASGMLVSPGSVVTKTISVRTLDGLQTLFPENTMLPHFASMERATGDQSGSIKLPIYEGDQEIQEVIIRDIPKDLPVGTPVRVEVSIQADYHIRATASVPSIRREVEIVFQIDPLDTASLTVGYIRSRMAELRQNAEKAAAECARTREVQVFWVQFNALPEEIEMELRELEPNRLKIREKLVAMVAQIRDVSKRDDEVEMPGMTFDEFSKKLTETETEGIRINHPKLAIVRPQIERLRSEGKEAWSTRDRIGWLHAIGQIDSIESALRPEKDPKDLALGYAGHIIGYQLPALTNAGAKTSDLQGIEEEALAVIVSMQVGNIRPEDAVSRLSQCYRKRILPLRKRLGLETGDDIIPDEPFIRSGSGLTR